MVSGTAYTTTEASITSNHLSKEKPRVWGTKWWNINIPQDQWTENCPEFLLGQGEKNIQILSTPDENYPRRSWSEAKHLTDTGRIDQFHRTPSDLRRYIEYIHDLKKEFGSVLYFIQHKRLNWATIQPTDDSPFTNDTDYKILYNDWPYSLDQDISHLVIWTKFALEEDPDTGRLKPETKQMLEDFVVNTFCQKIPGHARMERSSITWFKNWTNLRSVHALEHFHVMLYKAPKDLLEQVTNGDIPMCEQSETL